MVSLCLLLSVPVQGVVYSAPSSLDAFDASNLWVILLANKILQPNQTVGYQRDVVLVIKNLDF